MIIIVHIYIDINTEASIPYVNNSITSLLLFDQLNIPDSMTAQTFTYNVF